MRTRKPRSYRIPNRGVRKLHINGVEYKYRISGLHVIFFLPKRKLIVPGEEICFPTKPQGYMWWFEKGQYKGTQDGMITPRKCKDYLTAYLAEETQCRA